MRAQLLNYDVTSVVSSSRIYFHIHSLVKSTLIVNYLVTEKHSCYNMSSSSVTSDTKNQQKVQEAKEGKKMTPMERFHSLARSVQSQNRWTKSLQSKIAEQHSREFSTNRKQSQGEEALSFNVSGKRAFPLLFHTSVF